MIAISWQYAIQIHFHCHYHYPYAKDKITGSVSISTSYLGGNMTAHPKLLGHKMVAWQRWLPSNESRKSALMALYFSKAKTYHCLYGSTSCCISMGLVNGRRRFSTPHSSETTGPIFMKLEISKYFQDRFRMQNFRWLPRRGWSGQIASLTHE